jgi:hypothetical protein
MAASAFNESAFSWGKPATGSSGPNSEVPVEIPEHFSRMAEFDPGTKPEIISLLATVE